MIIGYDTHAAPHRAVTPPMIMTILCKIVYRVQHSRKYYVKNIVTPLKNSDITFHQFLQKEEANSLSSVVFSLFFRTLSANQDAATNVRHADPEYFGYLQRVFMPARSSPRKFL